MATRLNNPYLWAYTAAILLHILFLLVENPLSAIIAPQPEKIPVSPPLTFEFVDVPQNRDEVPPEETPLLAERDNISRDQQTAPLPESHLPFSDGISRAKNTAAPAQGKSRSETQSADRSSETETTDNSFSFVEVLQKNPDAAQKERERAVLGGEVLPQLRIDMDNSKTRALEHGGLQLSTYAWNYAPYMKYLQRRIDRHIYPPRAFELGMIDGRTVVKFRIWRDGRLEGPELIDYEGSDLLRDTSLKAVELSAPFRALPPDFPEEYLDITGTFEYIIFGRGQRR